jgi:hypothetical protein
MLTCSSAPDLSSFVKFSLPEEHVIMKFSVNWRYVWVAMRATSWNKLQLGKLLTAQMAKKLAAFCRPQDTRDHNGNKKFWEELIAYFTFI